MNQKEKQAITNLMKQEGTKKLRESKFILVNKARMNLYFVAHTTCARCMVTNSPCYQEVSMMYLNPLFIKTFFTDKYMVDIIMYDRKMRGRQ